MSIRNDHIVIVGSGFAGIGLGIRLKQAGIHDFTILERAERVGGTWRDNTYPGVACDVPSHVYSFSFEPNPEWSRFYAPQEEILAYLEHCADKYAVRAHIRFGTAATSATFDERTGLWTVKTNRGETLEARVLVSGSGHALSTPVYPDIPGRDTFEGKAMHSARWDHAYALEGKTVAVIGTGASAIQIVPTIAPKVGRMHVFQRTAAWVTPKMDRPLTEREHRVFRRVPSLQKLERGIIYWVMESMAVGYVVDPRLNAVREHFATKYLEKAVADPVLRAKLTPTFRMGCKRVQFSNDYLPALQRDNVELVTDGITEIRPHAIVTKDGTERPVDAIVYATGFETSEAKPPFPIVGRGGLDLKDAWKDGIEAYQGTTVAGFPNFFMIIGPNLGLGHSSMIFMMESQFPYVLDAIQKLRARKLKFVDVRKDVQAKYNRWLQGRLARTVWNTGGCDSWYLTRGGKNTTAWPGFTFEYRLRMRRFDEESYDVVAEERGAVQPARVHAHSLN